MKITVDKVSFITYNVGMIEIQRTDVFEKWLNELKDLRARTIILNRIERLKQGNFGDYKNFDGIFELRIFYGPGYRLYGKRVGKVFVILLCAGTKDTQENDIKKAKKL